MSDPLRLGYKFDSAIPSATKCFNHATRMGKRTLTPHMGCRSPGLEVELIQMLVLLLNATDNYKLGMFNSTQQIKRELNEGNLDMSGKVDYQQGLVSISNVTVSNAIWTKHYCFAFLKPTNNKFLATFSPISPFKIGTWTAIVTSIVFSVLVSGCLYNIGQFSASHLVAKPLPPELATVKEFQFFLEHSDYHLYSKYSLKEIHDKYFRHSELHDAFNLFKQRGIQPYKSNNYGERYLARKGTSEFVTSPNKFMMPLSIQKAREHRTVANHVKIICLIGNVEVTEAIMIRNGKIAEQVNRYILRMLENGIERKLLNKYLGPKLVDYHGSDQSIEMLEVRMGHFNLLIILVSAMHFTAVVILLFELWYSIV